MDFQLTDDEKAIQETFRRFTKEKVVPRAREIDESKEFPRDLFAEVGRLGLFGMRYPEEYGGTQTSTLSHLLALEELSKGCLALAAPCMMQSLMGTYFIFRSGSEELCKRFLVPAIRGEMLGTICITEPGAGSDLSAITTRAARDGEDWVLNGTKTWITSAPIADLFTVFALTGDKELSIFLVEKGTPGLSVSRTFEKLGLWGSSNSEVVLEDCRIPCDRLLGEAGKGRAYLTEILAKIRLATAALALGVGEAASEEALRYANERVQFGRPIAAFQAIKMKLADMATDLEAGRRIMEYGAWREDQGMPNMREASMAKLFVSEAATRACDEASRVLASYGYSLEYPVQRYLRDVRFTLIGGGTSEILRLIIAKEIGA